MNTKQLLQIKSELTQAHKDFGVGLNKRAFFKLSDNMLGQDLVQDTFMKTWKYLVKGGKIDTMKAFLYHILNSLIIDEYRKHKPISLDVLISKGFDPGIDETESIINKIDCSVAVLLIKRLPYKYREIMLMRFVKDLSLQEISAINGQTKNTNAVQIHRGTVMMKLLHNKK